MSRLDKYRGIIPAFYACYGKDGNISPERVRNLTRYFVEMGVKGVYVNGSSGECIYLGVEERKTVIENVIKAAEGKLTVINHVACNNTRDSVELARHSESLGVDAIAAIPPIYFRLPDYSVAEYWNAMSAAAPHTDFVIYNIPQLAGTALTVNLFREMMKNPNVIAVKNSSMPVEDIQIFKAEGMAVRDDFIVFNGPDEQFVAGRAIGADGGIGGTYGVMPDLFIRLNGFIEAGEKENACALQYAINAIIRKTCSSRANIYAVQKEILRINENLDIGGVREPLENLCSEDVSAARDAAGMIRAARRKFIG